MRFELYVMSLAIDLSWWSQLRPDHDRLYLNFCSECLVHLQNHLGRRFPRLIIPTATALCSARRETSMRTRYFLMLKNGKKLVKFRKRLASSVL
ncbi:hypothetical protein PIIN_08446 [Serendipita indica DSM 11827]|uniref:Uncharacterized protein n=1 Tax=Serendipita indica (strain DSM 11827) TaxID=1109443 RepID=G4TT51_SERID|nr:hypothetical protein PIIN_08446 [Serendipita indica DSM 11827]